MPEIPDLPNSVFEAGWVRDDRQYPSYKEFIKTAEKGQTYDFYADFVIEGEPKTFFFRRATASQLVRNYNKWIKELEQKIGEIATDYEEELGYIPEFHLNYVWRSINPVE